MKGGGAFILALGLASAAVEASDCINLRNSIQVCSVWTDESWEYCNRQQQAYENAKTMCNDFSPSATSAPSAVNRATDRVTAVGDAESARATAEIRRKSIQTKITGCRSDNPRVLILSC